MKKPSITLLQKIQEALESSKSKFVTADMLSQQIGIVPEKIQEACSFFNPLVTIDFTFDLKEILKEITDYVSATSKPATRKVTPSKTKVLPYQTVLDFIYDKMTYEGIVDKSSSLSDTELRLLKRIANEELKARREAKKKK